MVASLFLRGTRRADGRWLARIPAGELERELGTSAIGIHRAALHDILLGALPRASIRNGARVTAVTEAGEVTYDSQAVTVRLSADLVVGADGVHSVVRRQLWPQTAEPVHVGVRA